MKDCFNVKARSHDEPLSFIFIKRIVLFETREDSHSMCTSSFLFFFFFSFIITFWLILSRTYISAEQTTFSKCFYEYRSSFVCSRCKLTLKILFLSDQHVQGLIFYSNQFYYSIDIDAYLFALYYRWSSTNLLRWRKHKLKFLFLCHCLVYCIKDKEISLCIISIDLLVNALSSFLFSLAFFSLLLAFLPLCTWQRTIIWILCTYTRYVEKKKKRTQDVRGVDKRAW